MTIDIASQAVALEQDKIQQIAALTILRKTHEMQKQFVEMIESADRPAPPATGQGAVVDKTA